MRFENVIIDSSLETILKTLREDLATTKNREVFSVLKENGNNIQTICPFHKGGQERKPSFGINVETGACNCFTCGWKGYLPFLIGTLYGQDSEFGLKWLSSNFDSTSIETRPRLNLPTREQNQNKKQKITTISENELDTYRYCHPYMYKRGLTDPIIEKFDIGYDQATGCITFPVKDLQNNVLFVARRSVSTKYFNYPRGVDKPVYGAYLFTTGKYKKCYITESFFNCLTLWKLGYPAVALMGTGTKTQYEILRQLPVREYVIALDPDEAGQKGTQKLRNHLKDKFIVKEIAYLSSKDINDLQEEFINLKEIF